MGPRRRNLPGQGAASTAPSLGLDTSMPYAGTWDADGAWRSTLHIGRLTDLPITISSRKLPHADWWDKSAM